MSSLSVTFWILISASSIKAVVSRCNTNNLYTEFKISEDEAIGRTTHIWSADVGDSWTILKPDSTFVDLYFQNNTDGFSLFVNVTDDIDLDKGSLCTGFKKATFTLTCGSQQRNLTIAVTPVNEHRPYLADNHNISKTVPENAPLMTQVINYGFRVKDDDCPKQNISFSVAALDSAVSNKRDGTQYFGIYDNGTLYLKRALDYETVVCALGESGELYLNVLIKDDGADQMTATVSLTMTVLNVDDAPPKFLDKSTGCLEKCSACEQKSYIGNVTFDYTGIVPVHPLIQAKDIENNKSQIVYSILETKPKEYGGIISINDLDGTLTVDHSFQNVSGINNITQTEDFYVLVTIQARKNGTLRFSNAITVAIKVTNGTPFSFNSPDEEDRSGSLIIIILPVVAAIILLILLVLICLWKRERGCFSKSKYVVDEAKENTKDSSDDILFTQYAEVSKKPQIDETDDESEESSNNVENAEDDEREVSLNNEENTGCDENDEIKVNDPNDEDVIDVEFLDENDVYIDENKEENVYY